MPPLVSVIIPCRNAGFMLRPALASVIAQTYPNLEIIFVDDGSADESNTVARELLGNSPRAFTITTAEARGPNPARIHGLGLARGDYILWFDADDELAREKIALQVAAMEAQPEIDIAYGDWVLRLYQKGAPPREIPRQVQHEPDQIRRTLSLVWHPPHMFLLRRRIADLLAAEQAWWPDRKVATDIEYFAVAALLGLTFVRVPRALSYYNIWSEQQIGSATPYPLRAATLKEIYARLATLAQRPEIRPRLNREHRELLAMEWDVWGIPRGSIAHEKRGPDAVKLIHRKTGRALEVQQRAAVAVQLIEASGQARFLAHHAGELIARAPNLYADQAELIFLLDRFRRAGLFTRIVDGVPVV